MTPEEKSLLQSKGYSDQDIADFEAHEGGQTAQGTSGAPVANEDIPAVTQNMPQYHDQGIVSSALGRAGEWVAEHPKTTAAGTIAAGSMLFPQTTNALASRVPGVSTLQAVNQGIQAWSQHQLNDALRVKAELANQGMSDAHVNANVEKLMEKVHGIPQGTTSPTPTGMVNTANPANPNIAAQRPFTPSTTQVPPATSVPQAQAQAGNFLNNIAQKYGQVASKVAPVLEEAAPYLRGASKMITPALLAKELFYTSPEERAILQKAEAEKRATGWKPLNER
jgi:LysM repeat protein